MKKILGIDPGKDKTGAALCEESGKILRCEVLLMEHFLASLQKFLDHVPVTECVLGNGTTSASMQKTLLAAYPDLAIHIIDEAHSTEEARQLYWKLHPPKGLMKLIPLGMRTPPGTWTALPP